MSSGDESQAIDAPEYRTLGHCPDCETAIPSALLLIEYETSAGHSRFAECPDCGDVVHPRSSA